MKRAVLTALAALGVGAGLAVTASSTTHEAYLAGMRGLALAAVVVVLEVTNVLGTWVLLTDSRRHACVEAGVFVGAASLVTGWCGVLTYGPIGLVGPAFVLAGVELARLGATSPTPRPIVEPKTVLDAGVPVHPDDRTPDEPGQAPTTTPTEEAPERAPSPSDEDIVAQLLTRDPTPGRDAVCTEFRCGKTKAERVLRLVADRRRPHLVTEATS